MTWDDLDLRKLEAEAFLSAPGAWKNFEEMELHVTLDELEAILEAAHEREHRQNKFLAALQGVDLDKGNNANKERFDAIKRRVEARQNAISEEAVEFQALGMDSWDDF